MDENQVIINNLHSLYLEWKCMFANLSIFSNEIIRDLLEKLQSAHEIICLENTPFEVFHFLKFCKMMLEGLTTDLTTTRMVHM